jgi:hypothetical protein
MEVPFRIARQGTPRAWSVVFHNKEFMMNNQNPNMKYFAFKLAAKQGKSDDPGKRWQARDGVAAAGCTGPFARAGRYPGTDNGIYC